MIIEDIEINGIAYNSKEVKENDLFVAIPGTKRNGTDFIPEAIKKGAKIIVSEKKVDIPQGIKLQIVPSARKALAEYADKFYNSPSQKLKIIGVTGTNGKSTTAYLINSILEEAGFNSRFIGTINSRDGLTTPQSLDLQKTLSDFIQENVTHAVLEVSSHALEQDRVHKIDFDIGVFTNLTHDHLDYHKTMDNYLKAKQKLFASLGKYKKKNTLAIINRDDPFSQAIAEVVTEEVVFYGLEQARYQLDPELKVTHWEEISDGILIKIGGWQIESSLLGAFNIYNILAAINCAYFLGINFQTIKKAISKIKTVPGRMQYIDKGQPFKVCIDFAHSPDSLSKILEYANKFKQGKIILVFGCPGERDKEKRKVMGEIADKNTDFSIITTDDPHNEDPKKIINQIEKGFKSKNYKKITDRKKAIKEALKMANKQDTVIIAGRGHETIQDFGKKKIKLDDRIVCEEILKTYKR